MATGLNRFGLIGQVPVTVEAGFNKFLTRIRTTPAESSAAASHRRSIEATLQVAFSMSAFFRTGSFGSGVNVAGESDVDYFAVIPREKLKANSARSLEEVASSLRDRFPLSAVRVDGPGIRIPFGSDGAESTEIVPVDVTGLTKLGFRQFEMPDGSGGWMFTAPESHKAYVDLMDERLSGALKPLIRFLKTWNFKRGAGIKSFYLEMWATRYASTESCIVFDIDLSRVFGSLLAANLQDLADPRFPNDPFIIKGCNTEIQRQDALQKLVSAYQWSQEAVHHRLNGRIEAAYDRWNLVFNHGFPPYSGLL